MAILFSETESLCSCEKMHKVLLAILSSADVLTFDSLVVYVSMRYAYIWHCFGCDTICIYAIGSSAICADLSTSHQHDGDECWGQRISHEKRCHVHFLARAQVSVISSTGPKWECDICSFRNCTHNDIKHSLRVRYGPSQHSSPHPGRAFEVAFAEINPYRTRNNAICISHWNVNNRAVKSQHGSTATGENCQCKSV